MKRLGLGLVLLIALLALPAFAGNVKPSKKDKCPVCGMFVYKYPDWLAHIEFRDGTREWFDGPKDAFKYYLALDNYSSSRKTTDIESFSVTEYYGLLPIDAKKAYYVQGSDVYGPMGRELVPLETKADAEEFMRDHNGKSLLTFDELTHDIVTGLDR